MAGNERHLARATLCLLLAGGCAMPEPPGELVGTYSIEGALTKNECGSAALPAADPLVFDAELREDDGKAYWLTGMPPAFPGSLGDDGAFSFQLTQTFNVDRQAARPIDPVADPDPEALADPERYQNLDAQSREPCVLAILERISGTVLRGKDGDQPGAKVEPEADAEDADLIADNEIVISGDSATACAKVLKAQGGPFEALPCTAHYDLTGSLQ